jgi:hypothetical protein
MGGIYGGNPTLLLTGPDGQTIAELMDFSGHSPPAADLLFASTDCTGTKWVPAVEEPGIFQVVVGSWGGVVYYPPASVGTVTPIQSELITSYANQGQCDSAFGVGNGVFVPPDACCHHTSYSYPVAPALSVDLSGFAQPFRVDIK